MTPMAAQTSKELKQDDTAQRHWEEQADAEQRALGRHREFRAILARAAEAAKQHGGRTEDEVSALRELTLEDEAEGRQLLAELERQTAQEEATATTAQRNGSRPSSGGRRRAKS